MRIHICNHELPKEVEVVENKDGTYRGISFIVERYKHGEDDDDSSAVTFWYRDDTQKEKLRKLLQEALNKLNT
jgi:hypothetical protein